MFCYKAGEVGVEPTGVHTLHLTNYPKSPAPRDPEPCNMHSLDSQFLASLPKFAGYTIRLGLPFPVPSTVLHAQNVQRGLA
jgi:hypothetical protein